MESWIARKPTIELIFEKHPLFYDPALSALNASCDSPEKIVAEIETQLSQPDQTAFQLGRKLHLSKWCNSPDGQAAANVACSIAAALKKGNPPKKIRLDLNDYRRALKLKAYQSIGQPYTFFPLQQAGKAVFGKGKNFSRKLAIYEKSVTPKEILDIMRRLKTASKGEPQFEQTPTTP